MHPHPSFRHPEQAANMALVEQIGFGTVFAETPAGPRVGHAALSLAGEGRVQFHLSRGNALTRHLAGKTALIVVNGPHAYVSSRWYADPNQVPTWNYLALELEGPIRQLEPAELLAQVEAISDLNEARIVEGQPWTMDKLTDDYRDKLLRGIVGFEMTVEQRRETIKLSQNKPVDERHRIAEGLHRAGSAEIANAMRELGG